MATLSRKFIFSPFILNFLSFAMITFLRMGRCIHVNCSNSRPSPTVDRGAKSRQATTKDNWECRRCQIVYAQQRPVSLGFKMEGPNQDWRRRRRLRRLLLLNPKFGKEWKKKELPTSKEKKKQLSLSRIFVVLYRRMLKLLNIQSLKIKVF